MSNNHIPETGLDGFFGNPLSFGCSDIRGMAIIAEGVDKLNKLLDSGGLDAATAFLQSNDPLIKMAALTRFGESLKEMMEAISSVNAYFVLMGAPQTDFFNSMLLQLNAVYQRIMDEAQPEIAARLQAGFDTPWEPNQAPKEKPSDFTEEDAQRVSFIFQQLLGGDAHTKPLDH